MQPQEAFWTDRAFFDKALDELIADVRESVDSAATNGSATANNVPAKRVKTHHSSSDESHQGNADDLYVPLSQATLSDSPHGNSLVKRSSSHHRGTKYSSTKNFHTASPRNYTATPFFTPTTFSKRMKPWHTLSNSRNRPWESQENEGDHEEALLKARHNAKLAGVSRHLPQNEDEDGSIDKRLARFPTGSYPGGPPTGPKALRRHLESWSP